MAALDNLSYGERGRQSVIAQLRYLRFSELVSLGLIPGAKLTSIGTTITGLSTANNEVAFREGAQIGYGSDLSASTVYLYSTSGSDTGTYKIQGLNASNVYAEATVTATGTTAVAFSGTWNHVQRCISTSATNVGTVYVSTKSSGLPAVTGDQIQTVMPAGTNYAINPMIVCPSGKTILLYEFDFSSNTDNDAIVYIDANREGMWIQNFKFYLGTQFGQQFLAPIKLYEGDKLRVSVEARVGTNNDCTFGMNGIEITNSESFLFT